MALWSSSTSKVAFRNRRVVTISGELPGELGGQGADGGGAKGGGNGGGGEGGGEGGGGEGGGEGGGGDGAENAKDWVCTVETDVTVTLSAPESCSIVELPSRVVAPSAMVAFGVMMVTVTDTLAAATERVMSAAVTPGRE